MKGWIVIIVLVVIIAVGVFFYIGKKKKEQDTADRLVLSGMNREEFYARIIPLWKDKWVGGSVAYALENTEFIYETAWIHCKDLFKECEETLSGGEKNCVYNRGKYALYNYLPAEIGNCAKPKIVEGFTAAFYEDKPNPMQVQWARDFWLPLELNKMGIGIHKAGVMEILSGIAKNIKK